MCRHRNGDCREYSALDNVSSKLIIRHFDLTNVTRKSYGKTGNLIWESIYAKSSKVGSEVIDQFVLTTSGIL